jgi:hypothetical protein
MNSKYHFIAHLLSLFLLLAKAHSFQQPYSLLQPYYDITSISNKLPAHYTFMSDTSNSSISPDNTPPDSPITSLLLSPSFGFPLPPSRSIRLAPAPILPPSSSTSTTMSTGTKQVTIGGVVMDIKIGAEQVRTSSGAIYLKADRAKLSERDKIDLLKLISSKQQQIFASVTISINDPQKLINNHSTSKLLEECDRNISKFELRGVFTIVVPILEGSDAGALQEDSHGQALTYDLFADHLRLTAQQVADSSRWYSGFPPTSLRLQEDLEWSLSYFEKNCDPALYSRVHSKLMSFDKQSQGGPLLLKLILDETTTTADSNLKALLTIVETYKIKTSIKGERISDVVDLFRSISLTVYALNNDKLPSDFVKHYIHIFTTSSVPIFNDLFEDLKKQLMAARLQASITKYKLAPAGSNLLSNDMNTVEFVLEYANRAYLDLFQSGEWDACINKTPGAASHHTPVPGATPSTPRRGLICFNCGKDHHLRDCPEPRDEVKIAKARTAHPNGSRNQQQPVSFQKPVPRKWRPPEAGENNKRVIDNFPYTYNPTTRGWDRDVAPLSGLPSAPPLVPAANVVPPSFTPPPTLPATPTTDATGKAGFFAGVNPFGLSYSSTQGCATEPYQRKLQLQQAMLAITAEWKALSP